MEIDSHFGRIRRYLQIGGTCIKNREISAAKEYSVDINLQEGGNKDCHGGMKD
jgi:hypothetical protein